MLSRRLESELGWQRISCDEIIEERLENELKNIAGHGEHRLAAWMGYPWQPLSSERQELYLLLEEQVLDEICDAFEELARNRDEANIVLDATGSCIYVADEVLRRLAKFSTVVYLEASDHEEERLIEAFFKHPKPIIWNDLYKELDGEDHETAIRRCYLDLLETRRSRYEALASVRLQIEPQLRLRLSAEELIAEMQSALRVGTSARC